MTEEQKVSVPEAATTEQAPVVAEVKEESKSPLAEKAVDVAPAEVKSAAEVKPEPVKEVEPVKEAEKPVEPVKEAEKPAESVEEPVKTEENNEDSILSAGDDEVKKIIDGLNDSMEDDDDAVMLDSTEGENGGASDEPAPENPPTSLRNVKIARIPKEVFDFMVKDEGEEGTVRINLTQMRYFLQEELWKLAKYVNGSVWDKCEFPVLDMLVPSNAPQHITVQTFNTLKIADEEKRITKELEKIQKLEANQYKKMSAQHKKKVWADLEKKFTMKDNLIQRVGAHPLSPKKAGQTKANTQTPKKAEQSDVPSQIQPAVPVEGAAAVTPATKATPTAQNGATKSENARKRPVQSSGATGDSTPAKRNRNHENGNKNQGQKNQGGFPKKNNGNNGSNKFNNGPNRFNNQNIRRNDRRNNFEGTQPWSKPIMNNFNGGGYNSSFRTPAAPAISAFTPTPSPYDSIAERERSLIERERRLFSVAAETQFQSSYSSAYGSSSAPTSDYRTTYDNYANSAAFGTSGSTGSSYPSSGYSSFTGSSSFGGGDSGSSFSTGGYGGGNNFATSNNTYGSFLSSYGDNNQSQSRGRAGRKMGGRR